MAHTGVVYVRPRSPGGEASTFGTSGKLWRDALIMYDRTTLSLWSQIDGEAKAGPSSGQRLEELDSRQMTWAEWRRLHPETEVLQKPPLEASPYASYHRNASWVGLPWTRGGDDRLSAKTLVLGIEVEDDGGGRLTLAIPIDRLVGRPLGELELGGIPLLLVALGDPSSARIYDRRVAGQVLDFGLVLEHEKIVGLRDSATGSVWDPDTGVVSTGSMEGHRLRAARARIIYWAIWSRFHPETEVFRGSER